MDMINKFLNLVAPPTVAVIVFFLFPPIYLYRLFLSFLSSLFPEDMNHKVVLITGASSGIGEQMAYQYAKKGALLVLVARREGNLGAVAERAHELGSPDVLVVPADVSKRDDCRRFIHDTIHRFGRLDHLVNDAGISSLCLFEEATDVTIFTPVLVENHRHFPQVAWKELTVAEQVQKILKSLPQSWDAKVTAIRETKDLERLHIDQHMGFLLTHEIERKGSPIITPEEVQLKNKSIALRAKLSEEQQARKP